MVGAPVTSSPAAPVGETSAFPVFDVGKHVKLVPPFREAEVDSYFVAFEWVAGALRWPKEMWALLLQCKLIGKAQEVCASLSVDTSLDYDVVKAAVLRAYELVPEAYRLKFRNHKKVVTQTFVEFSREKQTLFDKRCTTCKVATFQQLCELMLLEDFKGCLSDNLVVHLNEHKVSSLAEAAVLVDEFVLTHKVVFPHAVRHEKVAYAAVQGKDVADAVKAVRGGKQGSY